MTNKYPHGEPKLVSNSVDIPFDTTLYTLPETLFLPSAPSLSQISQSTFPFSFPTNLDSGYQEQSSQYIP